MEKEPKFFVAITSHNQVFGIGDTGGRNIAWVFKEREKAKMFLKDFITFMPKSQAGPTLLSFNDPTLQELVELSARENIYPFTNPRVDLVLGENECFPMIIEGEIPTW